MKNSEVTVLSPVYNATCPSDESQARVDTAVYSVDRVLVRWLVNPTQHKQPTRGDFSDGR